MYESFHAHERIGLSSNHAAGAFQHVGADFLFGLRFSKCGKPLLTRFRRERYSCRLRWDMRESVMSRGVYAKDGHTPLPEETPSYRYGSAPGIGETALRTLIAEARLLSESLYGPIWDQVGLQIRLGVFDSRGPCESRATQGVRPFHKRNVVGFEYPVRDHARFDLWETTSFTRRLRKVRFLHLAPYPLVV